MPPKRALPSEVKRLRGRMDELNLLLVALLQLRARLALSIGRAKAQHGLAAGDPARERAMLARMLADAPPGFTQAELGRVLRAVLTASRRLVVHDRAAGGRSSLAPRAARASRSRRARGPR